MRPRSTRTRRSSPAPSFRSGDQELLFELDYSYQIAPWWTLQADAQEIIHPGGNVPNPLNPSQAIPNAFLLAARSSIKF